MSTSADTQDAVNTFELGPVIGDAGSHPPGTIFQSKNHTTDDSQEHGQSSQDGDEIASDEKAENASKIIGEGTKYTSHEAMQAEVPSSSPSPPLSLQRTRSGMEAADRREKQSSEQKGSNAMLNLPPPLPFDLKVPNLWVGVPHSGPSRYVRAACRLASGADV
jgi:hypothetical protein